MEVLVVLKRPLVKATFFRNNAEEILFSLLNSYIDDRTISRYSKNNRNKTEISTFSDLKFKMTTFVRRR